MLPFTAPRAALGNFVYAVDKSGVKLQVSIKRWLGGKEIDNLRAFREVICATQPGIPLPLSLQGDTFQGNYHLNPKYGFIL